MFMLILKFLSGLRSSKRDVKWLKMMIALDDTAPQKWTQTFTNLSNCPQKSSFDCTSCLLKWQGSTRKCSADFAWKIHYEEPRILHQNIALVHSTSSAKAFTGKHNPCVGSSTVVARRKVTVKRIGVIPNVSERKVTNGMNINRKMFHKFLKNFLDISLTKWTSFRILRWSTKGKTLKMYSINDACCSWLEAKMFFKNFIIKLRHNIFLNNLIKWHSWYISHYQKMAKAPVGSDLGWDSFIWRTAYF